jgi:mitogen-activated protein kinase organizer 1
MYGPPLPDEAQLAAATSCAGVLAGHEGAVLNVRYSANGAYALSCGKDRTVRLWSLSKRALLKTYDGHGHEVRDVACTADSGRLASVGGDRQVFLWDVSTGRVLRKFRGHDSAINAVLFAAGGDLVLTAGYDACVRAWDARASAAEPVQTLRGFRDSVTCLALHDATVLAGCVDGQLRAFDARAGQVTSDQLGAPVTVAALSADGGLALAALAGGMLRLLDRASGRLLAQYVAGGSAATGSGARTGAGLSCDDACVCAGGEDGRVRVWGLLDGGGDAEATLLEAHLGRVVTGLACHPSLPAAMLTCATDGLIKMWQG